MQKAAIEMIAMIDYISWAKEYEDKADKLMQRIDELCKQRDKSKSLDERHSIDVRLISLKALLREYRQTANHLRERGEKYLKKDL